VDNVCSNEATLEDRILYTGYTPTTKPFRGGFRSPKGKLNAMKNKVNLKLSPETCVAYNNNKS
jgi:hypothetical protein